MRLKRRSGVLVACLVATGCSSGANGSYTNVGSTGTSGPASGSTSSGTSQTSGSSSGNPTSGSSPSGTVASGSTNSGSATGGSTATTGASGGSGAAAGASGTASSGASTTGASAGTSESPNPDSGIIPNSGNPFGTGTGSTSGSATGNSSGSGAASGTGGNQGVGPFTCNLVLGLFTTSQWFNGTNPGGASKSFIMDGVDTTKWESKTLKYSYIEKWIPPTSALWNLPINNPCATNSTAPDRVVFVAFSPGSTSLDQTQTGWQTLLTEVVATIRMKYPMVKQIDLLTMGRAPNNMLCPNNNDVWTVIPPYEDAAYAAVAAASTSFPLVIGPKYYVPDCNSYIFANDTDYTTTGSNYIAQQLATYYIAHP